MDVSPESCRSQKSELGRKLWTQSSPKPPGMPQARIGSAGVPPAGFLATRRRQASFSIATGGPPALLHPPVAFKPCSDLGLGPHLKRHNDASVRIGSRTENQ